MGFLNLLEGVYKLGKTLMTSKTVSEAELERRLLICNKCPLLRKKGENLSCGACGCKISRDSRRILNLALYDKPGCPEKKWK